MLTHLDSQGRANMVDVTAKAVTAREAVDAGASCLVAGSAVFGHFGSSSPPRHGGQVEQRQEHTQRHKTDQQSKQIHPKPTQFTHQFSHSFHVHSASTSHSDFDCCFQAF